MQYRKLGWTCLLVIAWLGCGATVMAADTKIGLVDFQRILDESAAGKAAQAEFNKRGKEMEAELKTKGEELEAMRTQLQNDAMVMTNEMREEKEREFRIKVNDFKELQKSHNKTVRELQMRAIARIRHDVQEMIKSIGEKEGYSLIIEKQEAGVLFTAPDADLTDRIIKRYDTPPKTK